MKKQVNAEIDDFIMKYPGFRKFTEEAWDLRKKIEEDTKKYYQLKSEFEVRWGKWL